MEAEVLEPTVTVMQQPSEPVLDLSNDVLYKDMVTLTETKTEAAAISDEVIEKTASESFEPSLEPDEDFDLIQSNDGDKKPLGEKEIPYDYNDAAETVVFFIDGVMQFGLPFVYKRVAFPSPEERNLVNENERRFILSYGATKPNSVLKIVEGDSLFELYERWVEVKEIIKDIPLTDVEAAKLMKPWARCLQKWGRKPGPEMDLIMANVAVYTSRFAPLMGGGK